MIRLDYLKGPMLPSAEERQWCEQSPWNGDSLFFFLSLHLGSFFGLPRGISNRPLRPLATEQKMTSFGVHRYNSSFDPSYLSSIALFVFLK